jgi:hypothetical protein
MRLIKDNGTEIFEFTSTTEVKNFSKGEKFKKQSADFFGEQLGTWEQVQKRIDRDWAEGMYILNKYLERIKKIKLPEIKSRKRKTTYSEHGGDEVDFDRLYAGLPFWRTTVREDSDGPPTITVVVDTTTPYDEKVENILWRGAAAIALTEVLEQKGYAVELWVVNGSKLYKGENTKVLTACNLKKCSDPLDTSTLINTVAGWFYRAVIFTLLYTICDEQGKQPEYGLGRCTTPTQNNLDKLTTDANRVYIAGVFSFDGAMSVVQAELKNLAEKDTDKEESKVE